jgi:microcystin-dependent protein
MSSPFVGQLKLVAFDFAPVGWALCNGQLLPISQYEVIFNLIGTTYGGDGSTNFALPNLRSRVPIHQGTNANVYTMGQTGGEEAVILTTQQLPAHTHWLQVSTVASASLPGNTEFLAPADPGIGNTYGTSINAQMENGIIGPSGAGQPHENLQPYLSLNYIIALEGIYPSQG